MHEIKTVVKQQPTKNSNSFAVILAFIAVIIVGISLVPFVSFQINPVKELPQLYINFNWPNTSPEIIEKEVTVKIEGILNTLSNLKKITSVSANGEGYVQLFFDEGTNIDEKRFEVSSSIRQIYSQLPKEVSYPSISISNIDEVSNDANPILSFVLNGSATSFELQKYATEKIKTKLALVEGVGAVKVYGGNLMAWNIICDPKLLNAFSVNYLDIHKSLTSYFEQQSLGIAYLKANHDSLADYNIHLTLKNVNTDNIVWNNIPIKKTDNRIIYLKDIATVHYEEEKSKTLYRINGLNSINVLIFPVKGENNLRLANKVKAEISKITSYLPIQYSLLKQFDSTDYVKSELNKIIYRAICSTLIIFLFLFFITRSTKYLLFILISLIATIAVFSIFTYFLKIDIHIFSLAGIITSLGLTIGNSLVVISHYRKHQNFKPFLGLIGSTLVAIIAFGIAFLLPDELKVNITDFACIIIIMLISSLIVSLLLLPALLIKFPFSERNRANNNIKQNVSLKAITLYSWLITFCYRFKKVLIIIFIFSFGLPLFLLPTKLEKDTWYSNLYNKTIGTNFYKNNLKPFVNEVSGGTLRLFIEKVSAYSFHSSTNSRTTIYVEIQLPHGSKMEHINSVLKKFEFFLKKYKEVQQFTCVAYNTTTGLITINFNEEFEKSSFPAQLKGELASQMFSIGGANCLISGVGEGLSNSASAEQVPAFQVIMKGYNYSELKNQIELFKSKLEISSRIKNIHINKQFGLFGRNLYEYKIELDNYKLSSANIPVFTLYQYLLKQSAEIHPEFQISLNEKKEQVLITQKGSSDYDLWRFYNNPTQFGNDSKIFKVSDFAKIVKEQVNSEILKENQQYICNVSFDYFGSQKLGLSYLKKVMTEMEKELPIGYSIENKSVYLSAIENIKEQYGFILLAIILIYLVSAIIFESLLQPMAIILTIPLSFIGAFMTFSYFDINFDGGGFASFLLLSGIVTSSAICIINDYNNILKINHPISKMDAYVKAFNNKIIPIILTIIVTCAGLLPFLFVTQEDFFWYSLAAGTIGGLIFFILVLPIFLPLFLNLKKNERRKVGLQELPEPA